MVRVDVNAPNECTEELAAQIKRLLGADDPRSRAHALLAVISATGATDELVAELETLAAPEHLSLALALRSLSLRSVTHEDRLVIVERFQLDGCERIADRLLELNPSGDLRAFGADLRLEVETAREWIWHSRGMPVLVLLIVLCGLMVVLGGIWSLAPLVVAGVVGGAALVYALVLRQRKQRWVLAAEELSPMLTRVGR